MQPQTKRPELEENHGCCGPLLLGRHILFNHIPPDRDTLKTGTKRDLQSGKITVVSALRPTKTIPPNLSPPQHSTHLGSQQTAENPPAPQRGLSQQNAAEMDICGMGKAGEGKAHRDEVHAKTGSVEEF